MMCMWPGNTDMFVTFSLPDSGLLGWPRRFPQHLPRTHTHIKNQVPRCSQNHQRSCLVSFRVSSITWFFYMVGFENVIIGDKKGKNYWMYIIFQLCQRLNTSNKKGTLAINSLELRRNSRISVNIWIIIYILRLNIVLTWTSMRMLSCRVCLDSRLFLNIYKWFCFQIPADPVYRKPLQLRTAEKYGHRLQGHFWRWEISLWEENLTF